jgi:hypothetical protein
MPQLPSYASAKGNAPIISWIWAALSHLERANTLENLLQFQDLSEPVDALTPDQVFEKSARTR